SGTQDSVIDVVNWGPPNPNWPNYQAFQTYFWVNNAPTMPTDTTMSLQRYPDGRDTDQPTDWVALPRSPSHPPPTYTPTPSSTPSPTVTGSAVAQSATPTPTAFCSDRYAPDNRPSPARSLVPAT